MESQDLNEEDLDDAAIRMEASIPEDEAQIFATIRYNDIRGLKNWLLRGKDINFRHTGTAMSHVTFMTCHSILGKYSRHKSLSYKSPF